MATDPTVSAAQYTRDLFAILDEFFLRATGGAVHEFATVSTFNDVIRSSGSELAPRAWDAFDWLDTNIRSFYAERGSDAFRDAAQLGGMKLVLGGNSRFLGSHLNSVSTSVLYSNTVLIPDPVLPWLEAERSEERFRHVLLLQAVHTLLHLKPLVEADLPYPAVMVFPSWEKSLEANDTQTQDAISGLVVDLFSDALDTPLAGFGDLVGWADDHPDELCEAVDAYGLFVAPGDAVGEPLRLSLQRYEEEMKEWKSAEWIESYLELPTHRQVIYGVMERLGPIHHLLENSEELAANPLMCLEQHAHYFRLASHASNSRLEGLDLLDPKTLALVDGLSSRRLEWLGGIPLEAITRLRLDGENEVFRVRLAASIGRLHESDLTNINRVAAEVCHEIDAAIAEHDKELRRIQERYNRRHKQTAAVALAAAGVTLFPTLAPLLGATAPFALAAKYGGDKLEERVDKRTLAHSLVGVLAAAKPRA